MVRPPCGLAQTLPTSAQTEPQRTWQDARDPSDPANRATYIEQLLREAAVLGRTESTDTRDLLGLVGLWPNALNTLGECRNNQSFAPQKAPPKPAGLGGRK
jgi:hypothetical protein